MASRSHQNITPSATFAIRRALIAGTVAFSLAVALIVSVLYMLPARAFPGSLLPAQGAFLGSRVAPRGSESDRGAIRRVESQIGRKFDIDHRYYKWDAAIPTAAQQWDVDTGRIPFVNWLAGRSNGSVVSWSSIADGEQDGWIGRRADAFRGFGAPIYLTFHHEPEDDIGRWGSPQDFAAAFRRVVEIFRDHGANNVGFVWTLMSWTFDPDSGRDVNAFYPGDGYVDFVGSDGYNWYPGRPGSRWNSFQTIYQLTNDFAAAHDKPWMAVEYGVQEDPQVPGRKAQWFRDALVTAKAWPGLKALIYFDLTKAYPWDTDSSESSIQAYAEIANDPYLMQQAGGGPSPSPSPSPPPLPPPPGDTPSVVKNGLNSGPQGASIQARRGAVAPFDFVSTTRGATLTYDNSHSRGAFSAKHVLNARSDAYYQWNGARSVWYGRIFVWLDARPSGDLRLIRASVAGSLRCSINIRSSGKVAFADRKNGWIAQSNIAIPTGRWVRLEWKVDQRRGRVKIKIFVLANSIRPTEVVRAGPRLQIGARADYFQFGRSGANDFPITFWTDSPGLSTRRFLGPGAR